MSMRSRERAGRSTANTKFRRLNRPPKGERWSWIPLELIDSPAWRCLTRQDHLVLWRIIAEHLGHSLQRNGTLPVTYDDFVNYGANRNEVKNTLVRLDALGLVKRTYAGRKAYGAGRGEPAQYRLTFWAAAPVPGVHLGLEPSNEWKCHKSIEDAEQAIARALGRKPKLIFPSIESGTVSSTESGTERAPLPVPSPVLKTSTESGTTIDISTMGMADEDAWMAEEDDLTEAYRNKTLTTQAVRLTGNRRS